MERGHAKLKWIGLACPRGREDDVCAFYSVLGCLKRTKWWPPPAEDEGEGNDDGDKNNDNGAASELLVTVAGGIALEASGYEHAASDPFVLFFIQTAAIVDLGQGGSGSLAGSGPTGGPGNAASLDYGTETDKLVFFTKDIVTCMEKIEEMTSGARILQPPTDVSGHCLIAELRDPVGTHVSIVQLPNDRYYMRDPKQNPVVFNPDAKRGKKNSSSISLSARASYTGVQSWESRLAYVQIITTSPSETAAYLEGMFSYMDISEVGASPSPSAFIGAGVRDDDRIGPRAPALRRGLSVLDSEDFNATKYTWLGSAERDERPSLCFKHTPHADMGGQNNNSNNGGGGGGSGEEKLKTDGAGFDVGALIRPGRILAVGLTTTDFAALRTRIKERSLSLSSILHLGRPLRLVEMPKTRDTHALLQQVWPDALLLDLADSGKSALPKLTVALQSVPVRNTVGE